MRPSSRQALGRFLSNIDWLVLENVEDINEKYAFFNLTTLYNGYGYYYASKVSSI
jgi:hypothetical protein